jgi:hypothetical protein
VSKKVDKDKAEMDLRPEWQVLRDMEKLLIGMAEQLDRMEDKMGDGRWL